MKRFKARILIATVCIGLGLIYPISAVAGSCQQWVGKLVSMQGIVETQRHGQTQWQPTSFEETFCPGDSIRIGSKSRAAIHFPNDTILKLDELTTISFPSDDKEKRTLIDILKGAVYFIGHHPTHLKIITPFVNAAIEGTEFVVKVEQAQTVLTIFEGRVFATNDLGGIALAKGQSAIAQSGQAPAEYLLAQPRDAVQWALYYPPILDYRAGDFIGGDDKGWRSKMRRSIAFYWKGDLTNAFASLESIPEKINDPRFFVYRAGLLLTVGRVDEAKIDIKKAMALDQWLSEVAALESIIAISQNKKEEALEQAARAVSMDEKSAVAHTAMSYARQMLFDLEGALDSARTAIKYDTENALAWARLAELWLSTGNIKKALGAARAAVIFNPNLARTQTVLGFADLIQIKIADAIETFRAAIKLDPAAPLPRLGLGLTKIRKGDLSAGRSEIEIAAGLDPSNALIRSYLGKAYFEEKRDEHAANQLAMAKELDPNDPTAWFYDAIRKQRMNRPAEALKDLQRSIELNDNRGVYRSRLMLDEDLAARNASLGRIYSDLGFQQLALVEGWRSVSTDPTNFSAHRLLADSYAALGRHEIARVSELLQSQLLQPLNTTPLQPQLAESGLHILEDTGPSEASFNEYHPLFLRNRTGLQADGVYGSRNTRGDDLIVSGLYDRFSYSLGQFHYESDGFRANNDQDTDIYNALIQARPIYNTSFLIELRDKDRKYGDLALRFDPDNFDPTFRIHEEEQSRRIGFHHSFSPRSDLIATFAFQNVDSSLVDAPDAFAYTLEGDDTTGEVQHIYRTGMITAIGGAGYLKSDRKETLSFGPMPPAITDQTDRYRNYYLYTRFTVPETVNWSVGLSYDDFDGFIEKKQVNPKLGVIWNPIPELTLRAAAFRVFNRRLINRQTIEPVQIAGFNQFFGDADADRFWRYGAAVDYRFTADISGGIEISHRDLDLTYPDFSGVNQEASWEEDFGRFYLYWIPATWLAVSGEYLYEQFDRPLEYTGEESVHILKTHRWPLGIKLFCPFGFTAGIKAAFVDQEIEFQPDIFTPGILESDSDRFWVVDAKLSYRLPGYLGTVTLEAKNLFDKTFRYQPMDKFKLDIVPDRLILAKITLSF